MKPRIWYLALMLGLAACGSESPRTSAPSGTDGVASTSAVLALTPDGRTLWVANPDAGTVTPLDTESLKIGTPVAVGESPEGVAVTPAGDVIVTSRASGTLTVIRPDRATWTLFLGAELGGLALSPSGRVAYVTGASDSLVFVVDLTERFVRQRIPVGALPWAIAVTDDGDALDDDETVVVSHRMARLRPGGREATDDGKEGWLTLLQQGQVRDVPLAPYPFGFPNALEAFALRGQQLWIGHLLNAPAFPRDFETTVSAAVSVVMLDQMQEQPRQHIHLNETSFSSPVNHPKSLVVNAGGNRLYIALAGTDAVMGVNLTNPEKPKLVGFWPVGRNPRGIVLNAQGTRAYVMNFLSRDVSILDLSDEVGRQELARVRVAPETLTPEVLQGKILFNNAFDPRLSHLGWMACASCHLDGGSDGTTWRTEEGPRQTQPLWHLDGTAPFHASGTRDEVQDFEHDIETLMNGVGLAPAVAARALGEPNAGRSPELDALAAYILHGVPTPRVTAPSKNTDVGRATFKSLACTSCHSGAAWTNSRLTSLPGTRTGEALEAAEALKDVGTRNTEDLLGERGFDVPTLLGLRYTAPYLHDGSAASLQDVLRNVRHTGRALTDQQLEDLASFIGGIDLTTPPLENP